jgi:hypothetical protein
VGLPIPPPTDEAQVPAWMEQVRREVDRLREKARELAAQIQ